MKTWLKHIIKSKLSVSCYSEQKTDVYTRTTLPVVCNKSNNCMDIRKLPLNFYYSNINLVFIIVYLLSIQQYYMFIIEFNLIQL